MALQAEGFTVCPVLNLARATRFYTEVLGLRQTKDLPHHGWVELEGKGGLRIALRLRRGIHRLPPGGASLAFVVDDLGSANRELSAKGIRFREERMEIADYLVGFSFWDSEGNRIYLVQIVMPPPPEAPRPEAATPATSMPPAAPTTTPLPAAQPETLPPPSAP